MLKYFPGISSVLRLVGRPPIALPISAAAFLVLALGEQDLSTLPFLLFITLAIICLSVALTSRIASSLYISFTLLLTVCAISHMKLDFMGMSIYVYDAYFYLSDVEVYKFLWDTYLDPIWLAIGVAGVGSTLSLGLLAVEARWRASRRIALVSLLIAGPAAALTYPYQSSHTSFYMGGHRTTSFFTSLFSSSEAASEISLYRDVKPDPHAGAYDGEAKCRPPDKLPDIVVTLMESAMPPALYTERVPSALNEAFDPNDIHPLRVETFGGGTWVSSIGFMTSLATKEFGWARPYLPVFLTGRVHHSLPQFLKKCGYRTAIISPLTYNFVNEGAFMTSIGVDDYLDFGALHAPTKHERDDFYFNAALRYLADQHRTADAPVFLFILTMAPHGPYRDTFLPTVKIPGAPSGNGREMDEYLRRLAMQQFDYRDFLGKIPAVSSSRGTVLLEFGDHQPALNPPLTANMAAALSNWDSIAYLTYYRMKAIGYTLRSHPPEPPSLDMAYLAPTLLEAIGLPLDDYYAELVALRNRCNGVYSLCSDSGVSMLRSRILNSRFLDLRQLTQSTRD